MTTDHERQPAVPDKSRLQHDTKWTVMYSSGEYQYFSSRESAMIEVLNYGGIGIREPRFGECHDV